MSKQVATSIMIAGVIVAVCAAAKLPDEGHRFPSTTGISVVGIIVAAVGMAMWRIADRVVPARADHQVRAEQDPLEILRQLQTCVVVLCRDAPSLDSRGIRERIDQAIDRFVLPFTQSRQIVVHQLGMQTGAQLLIEFALGERLLNRAWSAAADGHLPEALASLAAAEQAFAVLNVP